jgi:hypothetical protein
MRYAFVIAALAVAMIARPAAAQMKPPIPMTPAQFAQAVPGQSLILAVRVADRARDDVRAQLLVRIDDSHYRVTATPVDLYVPADTPMVMGSEADVKAGAVLIVHAVATTRGRADVKRVTVITPYINIQ